MYCYAPRTKKVEKDKVKSVGLLEFSIQKHLTERPNVLVESAGTSLCKVQQVEKIKSKEQVQMEILINMFKELITSRKEQAEQSEEANVEAQAQEEELMQLAEELLTLRLPKSTNRI